MTHGLLLVAALVVGRPDREAKEPTYKVVEVAKVADSVAAQKGKDRTVFVVTSESGIGGAAIVVASGEWPENVTLRFQYPALHLTAAGSSVLGVQAPSAAIPLVFGSRHLQAAPTAAPGVRRPAAENASRRSGLPRPRTRVRSPGT